MTPNKQPPREKKQEEILKHHINLPNQLQPSQDSLSHPTLFPEDDPMAMTVTFQLLAALANASAAAQAQAQAHAPRDVATGFFDYCDQGSLTWYPTSDQQAIEADCSTTGDPVYFESWLDLNYCFGNDNGTMALQIR